MNSTGRRWMLGLTLVVGRFSNAAISISTTSASKVTNLLPSTTESCRLSALTLLAETRMGCLALCQKTSLCLLACRKGNECRLYRTLVSLHFNGLSSGNEVKLIGFQCFSLWADKKDLASAATVSAIGAYDGTTTIDGFACASSSAYSFHYDSLSKPWILVDLKTSKMVDRVLIMGGSSHFSNVEVRVGGSSHIPSNTLLMHYNGAYGSNDIVVFKGTQSLQGRYVSIQSMNSTASFIVKEIKILPP